MRHWTKELVRYDQHESITAKAKSYLKSNILVVIVYTTRHRAASCPCGVSRGRCKEQHASGV